MKTYTNITCEKCDSEAVAKDYPRQRQDCTTDEDWNEWKDEPIALCESCATKRISSENARAVTPGEKGNANE